MSAFQFATTGAPQRRQVPSRERPPHSPHPPNRPPEIQHGLPPSPAAVKQPRPPPIQVPPIEAVPIPPKELARISTFPIEAAPIQAPLQTTSRPAAPVGGMVGTSVMEAARETAGGKSPVQPPPPQTAVGTATPQRPAQSPPLASAPVIIESTYTPILERWEALKPRIESEAYVPHILGISDVVGGLAEEEALKERESRGRRSLLA